MTTRSVRPTTLAVRVKMGGAGQPLHAISAHRLCVCKGALLDLPSGQEILDPREFMKRARDEMGAQGVDEWRANNPGGASSFAGVGQSLDGSSSVGQPIAGPPQEHTITFWANGFSVDDGPLRNAQDPENAAFLADVNRGRMPAELMGSDGNADGDVHIIDKSGEAYKPPKAKPFSGEGRTMRDESATAAAPQAVGGAQLVLDESQPTTTLQIRLSDGTRKVVKANHTHTVMQLQQHVSTFSAPGAAFTLSTTFPPKKLTEMDKTLAEAGVLNETLMQTIC